MDEGKFKVWENRIQIIATCKDFSKMMYQICTYTWSHSILIRKQTNTWQVHKKNHPILAIPKISSFVFFDTTLYENLFH